MSDVFDEEYIIEFGGFKITFYPLSMKNIRSHPEEMAALMKTGDNPFSPERFTKLLTLFTASAQQGNPNVTLEQIEQVVNIKNMTKVTRAVLGQDWRKDITVKLNSDGSTAIAEEVAARPTEPQTGGASTVA
jgi:hypothetical protein